MYRIDRGIARMRGRERTLAALLPRPFLSYNYKLRGSGRALLDPLFRNGSHDAIHEDARGVDLI